MLAKIDEEEILTKIKLKRCQKCKFFLYQYGVVSCKRKDFLRPLKLICLERVKEEYNENRNRRIC